MYVKLPSDGFNQESCEKSKLCCCSILPKNLMISQSHIITQLIKRINKLCTDEMILPE